MEYKNINKCYSNDFMELYHCDCMELLKQTPDNYYSLALVDPPYGIGVNKMTLGNGKKKIYRGENDWDLNIPNAEYFSELFRISKNQIVWGGNYMTEYLKPSPCWIFWDKNNGDSLFADGEMAWTSFDTPIRLAKIHWCGSAAIHETGQNKIHPTQKPIKLYDWCIKKYAKKNMKILDTHLGSGSIALAIDKANKINNMNLQFTGIELDEDYYNAMIKRFENYISQKTINFE